MDRTRARALRRTTRPLPGRRALVALAALLAHAARAQGTVPPLPPASAAEAQRPPDPCPAQGPVELAFAPNEALGFKLDVFGADVGSLEITTERAPRALRPKVAVVGHARARTSAFVSTNVARYEVFATGHAGPGLGPALWREEVDDGPVHWVHEVAFPAASGQLHVKATKDGEPAPIELPAPADARDMLSGFLLLRSARLVEGTPLCIDVYAGRRVWRMAGAVGPREELDGPMGHHKTVRLDLVSTRLDDVTVTRIAKFWITDDDRRLPIAAVAEVRGKVIRAQLYKASGKVR